MEEKTEAMEGPERPPELRKAALTMQVLVAGMDAASPAVEYSIVAGREDATVAWLLEEALRRYKEDGHDEAQAYGLRRLVQPLTPGAAAVPAAASAPEDEAEAEAKVWQSGVDLPGHMLLSDAAYPGARFLTLPYEVKQLPPNAAGQGFKAGLKKFTNNMVHGIKGFMDQHREHEGDSDEEGPASDGDALDARRRQDMGDAHQDTSRDRDEDLDRARSSGNSSPAGASGVPRLSLPRQRLGRSPPALVLRPRSVPRRRFRRRGSSEDLTSDRRRVGLLRGSSPEPGSGNLGSKDRLQHVRQMSRSLSPVGRNRWRNALPEAPLTDGVVTLEQKSQDRGFPRPSRRKRRSPEQPRRKRLGGKAERPARKERGWGLRRPAGGPGDEAGKAHAHIQKVRSISEGGALQVTGDPDPGGAASARPQSGSGISPLAIETSAPKGRRPGAVLRAPVPLKPPFRRRRPEVPPSVTKEDDNDREHAAAAAANTLPQPGAFEELRDTNRGQKPHASALLVLLGFGGLASAAWLLMGLVGADGRLPGGRSGTLLALAASAFIGFGVNEWVQYALRNPFARELERDLSRLGVQIRMAFGGRDPSAPMPTLDLPTPPANPAQRPPVGTTVPCWPRERDAATGLLIPQDVDAYPAHTWCDLDAASFSVRSVGYASHRKKAASGPAVYEVFETDCFQSALKITHLLSHLRLPVPGEAHRAPADELPSLLVINVIMPSEPPNLFAMAEDGACYSTVLYCRLSSWAAAELQRPAEERTAGLRLAARYFQEGPEGETWAGRLKAMVAIPNIEVLGLPSAIKRMNSKPVLLTRVLSFATSPLEEDPGIRVAEIDCDVFKFGLLARKGLATVFPKFHLSVQDIAFVIEGRSDEELPEQVLAAVTMSRIDKSKVPAFADILAASAETGTLPTEDASDAVIPKDASSDRWFKFRSGERSGEPPRNKLAGITSGFRIFGKQLRRRRLRSAEAEDATEPGDEDPDAAPITVDAVTPRREGIFRAASFDGGYETEKLSGAEGLGFDGSATFDGVGLDFSPGELTTFAASSSTSDGSTEGFDDD